MNRKKPRVALLIDTSTTWGRGLIEGIALFARRTGGWALTVESRGSFEKKGIPYNWQGDGVIGRLVSAEMIESIRRLGVPAINVSQICVPGSPFAQVTTDEWQVGRIAAEHLLERRFAGFGYYGPPHRPHYRDQIYAAFAQAVDRAQRPFSVFQPDRYFVTGETSHDDLLRLERWFAGLVRPAGVLTWNASGAQTIASACAVLGINVPGEIGILSGEHDDLMSMVSPLTLSAVDHNPIGVGQSAAEALARIMHGHRPAEENAQRVPPNGIIMGHTTEGVPLRDPLINQAVLFIGENLERSIGVVDIARALGVSRRALEVRFAKDRGRSPGQELRLARLARAKRLLMETNQTLAAIAEQSGFRTAAVLSRSFSKTLGVCPRDYRRAAAAGHTSIMSAGTYGD